MNEWMNKWMNEWMNEWKNEWMTKSVNEWINNNQIRQLCWSFQNGFYVVWLKEQRNNILGINIPEIVKIFVL